MFWNIEFEKKKSIDNKCDDCRYQHQKCFLKEGMEVIEECSDFKKYNFNSIEPARILRAKYIKTEEEQKCFDCETIIENNLLTFTFEWLNDGKETRSYLCEKCINDITMRG